MNSNTTNEIYEENRDLARAMAQAMIERLKAMPDAVEEEEAVSESAPRIIFGHDIVGRSRGLFRNAGLARSTARPGPARRSLSSA